MRAPSFVKTSLGLLRCPTISRLSLTSQSWAPPGPWDARVLPLLHRDSPSWLPSFKGGTVMCVAQIMPGRQMNGTCCTCCGVVLCGITSTLAHTGDGCTGQRSVALPTPEPWRAKSVSQ